MCVYLSACFSMLCFRDLNNYLLLSHVCVVSCLESVWSGVVLGRTPAQLPAHHPRFEPTPMLRRTSADPASRPRATFTMGSSASLLQSTPSPSDDQPIRRDRRLGTGSGNTSRTTSLGISRETSVFGDRLDVGGAYSPRNALSAEASFTVSDAEEEEEEDDQGHQTGSGSHSSADGAGRTEERVRPTTLAVPKSGSGKPSPTRDGDPVAATIAEVCKRFLSGGSPGGGLESFGGGGGSPGEFRQTEFRTNRNAIREEEEGGTADVAENRTMAGSRRNSSPLYRSPAHGDESFLPHSRSYSFRETNNRSAARHGVYLSPSSEKFSGYAAAADDQLPPQGFTVYNKYASPLGGDSAAEEKQTEEVMPTRRWKKNKRRNSSGAAGAAPGVVVYGGNQKWMYRS